MAPNLDAKEVIAKVLGFLADDFKISYFDPGDALVGHVACQTVAYEFDIEVDKKVLPFKLLEDVNRWEYVDLSIFPTKDPSKSGDENSLGESRRTKEPVLPAVAPFQLAGPMELWIQDAKDMRLSLPKQQNDVDAGVFNKVILADGAVVTVEGARSVSLRHPLDLPLPLNQTQNGFASDLLMLADRLRFASRTQEAPFLSLSIVGPTSLTSPSSSSSTKTSSPDYKLKLKRLAPGLVQLSSQSKTKAIEAISALDLDNEETTLLTPERFTTLWPLASVNGSNPNLLRFETLLSSVLGEKAKEEGSFKLLKAEASAQMFVKMVFGVEKRLKKGDGLDLKGLPEWRAKPEYLKLHFEVLAKVEGQKVLPEKVVQVDPVNAEDTVASNVLNGNMAMFKIPVVLAAPEFFTL